jgi:putative membrane protein
VKTIVGPVLTVTIWAAIVCYLASIGKKVLLTNTVLPLLSVVVGLILVFRCVYTVSFVVHLIN